MLHHSRGALHGVLQYEASGRKGQSAARIFSWSQQINEASTMSARNFRRTPRKGQLKKISLISDVKTSVHFIIPFVRWFFRNRVPKFTWESDSAPPFCRLDIFKSFQTSGPNLTFRYPSKLRSGSLLSRCTRVPRMQI